MKKSWIALIVFQIILIQGIHAIGLRSDSLLVDINYVPGFEGTYGYDVIPLNSNPTDVQVYVRDDPNDGYKTLLAKYFTLSDTYFKQIKPGDMPYFTVTVKLPPGIIEPGGHRVMVGVRELAPPGSGGFSTVTSIEAIFTIHVPYQGQYLKYYLSADNVNENESIPIKLILNNLGTDNINSLYADIDVLDQNNATVASTTTESITLATQESTTLLAQIPPFKVHPGNYVIRGTIHYDGKEEIAYNTFKVGNLNFDIINETNEIYTGSIDPIFVTVASQWANIINNVYADIKIGNDTPVQTLSETVNGFDTQTLTAYFDATNETKGIKPMSITLHYQDKTTTKDTQIMVLEQGITEFAKNMSTTSIIFIFVILTVIIINITLFILLIKKKDEKEI